MKVIKDDRAIERISRARSVAVLTGSGISAESGIPTFRDKDGLWTRIPIDGTESFESFLRDPAIAQEWRSYIFDVVEKAKPNSGHYALAKLAKLCDDFTLITQNIDGLHQKAGSENVIELHGNLRENYCIRCGRRYTNSEVDRILVQSGNPIPECVCGGLIRPNVVWFGEPLPESEFEKAYQSAVNSDIFISVGTSGEVRPASDLPKFAKYNNAFLIEINLKESELTLMADLLLKGKSGEILPLFVEDFEEIKRGNFRYNSEGL